MIVATALLALGLVLIVEGLVYALAPSLVEDLLAALRSLSENQRRISRDNRRILAYFHIRMICWCLVCVARARPYITHGNQ